MTDPTLEAVISGLQKKLPTVIFTKSSASYWSPSERTVYYQAQRKPEATWTLLHETGHAVLEHTSYTSDFELLTLEVAAWQEAKDLARAYNIDIDEEHVQDCLESYRDWLHQRSTCPRCGIRCLQDTPNSYTCHNCHAAWRVSSSRFCRPYRLSKIKTPSATKVKQTEFV